MVGSEANVDAEFGLFVSVVVRNEEEAPLPLNSYTRK